MARGDAAQDRPFEIRGVNHLALVCRDMATTVDFYEGVLGMPLVKTIELGGGTGQHFFFDCGNGDAIAFFWFPEAPSAAPGVAMPAAMPGEGDFRTAHGSMNHVAFDVSPDNIVLGNGSTEILQMIVQAATSPNALLVRAHPTFEAISRYQRVIEADPTFPLAYQGLAEVYSRKGQLEEAVRAIRKAIELEPDESLFHTSLSRFLQMQGRISEAEEAAAIAGRLQSRGGL